MSRIFLCTKEGNDLYKHKIFVLYFVKLSDSANLVILYSTFTDCLAIGNNKF